MINTFINSLVAPVVLARERINSQANSSSRLKWTQSIRITRILGLVQDLS